MGINKIRTFIVFYTFASFEISYQTDSQTRIERICWWGGGGWYLISRNNYNIHNNSYPLPDNVFFLISKNRDQ